MFNSGYRGKRAGDFQGSINPQENFIQNKYPVPTVSGYTVSGTDDTALDPAGGQTVLVNGGGFAAGCAVTVNGITVTPVTVVSPTQISFTSPANSGGSYTLIVYNSTGGGAILVPGLVYSSVPTYTTPEGSVGSGYETTAINTSVVATSDSSITYAVTAGALPSGASMTSGGVITGTFTTLSSGTSTTDYFTVTATDAENQDVSRQFSLTSNIDVVTWVAPSSGATITNGGEAYSQALSATDAAGYSVSYSADTLPTGLTLSDGVISGTPTVDATTSTILTATAATTNRTATNTITWVVSLSDIYFKYTTLLISADSSVTPSSFIDDNSINNSQLTVAGETRATSFNPYQYGYYSVNFAANGNNLYTASNKAFNISSPSTVWTFECWIRPYTSGYLFCIGGGGSYDNPFATDWGLQNANKFTFMQGTGGSNVNNINSTNTFLPGKWYHFAVSKDSSGVIRMFVNGVQENTVTNTSTTVSTGDTAVINGAYDNNGLGNNGGARDISNLRFVKGVALYTSNFTPSTAPLQPVTGTLLLACQQNRLIDSSPSYRTLSKNGTPNVLTAHPFTTVYNLGTQYYSYRFNYGDSTADNLALPTSYNSNIGAIANSLITIEFWLNTSYISAVTAWYTGLFGNFTGSAVNGRYMLVSIGSSENSTQQIALIYTTSTGSTAQCLTTATLTQHTWNHVAVTINSTTPSSSTVVIYINGVGQTYTGVNLSTHTTDPGAAFKIGDDGGGNYQPLTGCISNFRFVRGNIVYTGNFTPPTQPLETTQSAGTNIAEITSGQTKLLTCRSSSIIELSNSVALTMTGTVTPLSVSPFSTSYTSTPITTYGSGYFDGTGDYLSTTISAAGTGSFTYEAWIYLTVGGSQRGILSSYVQLASPGDHGIVLYVDTSNYIRFVVKVNNSSYVEIASPSAIPINTWVHVAGTRNGSSCRLWIDGVGGTPSDFSGALVETTAVIGTLYVAPSSLYFIGYISDARIVNGTALYTSNFVPQSTSPLTNVTNTQLLTLQSNGNHNNSRIIDSSPYNNILTRVNTPTTGSFSPYGDNWSVYYPAAAYTTIAANPFTFGTGANFTVEAWINITALPASGYYFSVFGSCDQSTLLYWNCGVEPSGKLAIQWYDGNSKVALSTSTLTLNTWYHVAYVASSGSLKMFLNGNLETLTGTTTLTNPTGNASYTTGSERGNHGAAAYVSNLRINNTALYSASFSVPSAPYTTNTTDGLLTAQSNRFIDNSVNNRTITISNASIQKYSPFGTITVPKYYTTQYNIANADGYLSVTNASNLIIGTNPFTIECWINIAQFSGQATIASNRSYNSTGTGTWSLYVNTSGALLFDQVQTPTNIVSTNTGVISTGTWYHVAVSRGADNTVRMFVNGNNVGTTSPVSTFNFSSTNPILIGKNNDATGYRFIGYMSNFRIVNGTGLYTDTFTPSTTPLTAVANTVFLNNSNSLEDISTYSNVVKQVGTALVQLQYGPPTFQTPSATQIAKYNATTFGNSIYLDGTGDYLTAVNSRSFDLSSGPWTIECWFYQLAPKQVQLFSVSAASWRLAVDTSGGAGFTFNTSSTTSYPAGSFPARQWNHISATFNNDGTGGAQRSYANGKLIATGQFWPNADTTNLFYIGNNKDASGAWDFNGYITDVLIIKGSSYNASFFPRSTPAQVTPLTSFLANGTNCGVLDSARMTDLDTQADSKITKFSPYNGSYYSVQYDGTSDGITFLPGTFGANDFTIEFWWYSNVSTDTVLLNNMNWYGGYTPGSMGFWYVSGVLYAQLFTGGGSDSAYAPTTQLTRTISVSGKWTHITLSRTGGNMYLGVDGTISSTALVSNTGLNLESRTTYAMGAWSSNAGGPAMGLNGYVSNLRIIKGSALYTTNYTVPTTPLTAVSGTTLLTCQSNNFIDNSASPLTITKLDTTRIATQNPFQVNTGVSMYFDGTGDYIANNTGAVNLAEPTYKFEKDFTIECWIFPRANNANIITFGNEATGRISFFVSSSNYLAYDLYGVGTTTFSTTAAKLNEWSHVAFVRSGSTITAYLNGSSSGTPATQAATLGVGPMSIGSNANRNGSFWNGYIADLRITKGYARTITVPVLPYR